MAVSDLEVRSMDTKAPLTPPSDRMEIDSHGDTFPNGHPFIEQSSLDKPSNLNNSSHVAPTDNLKSYLQNHAISAGTPDASQLDQDTADLHLPISSEVDVNSTAPTSSAPTDRIVEADINAHSLKDNLSKAPNPAPAARTPSAASTQIIDIQEQNHDVDYQANGLGPEASAQSESDPLRSEPGPGMTESSEVESAVQPEQAPMDKSSKDGTPINVTTADIPHHPPVPVPEGAELEAPVDPAPSPVQAGTTPDAPVDDSNPIIDIPHTSPPAEPSRSNASAHATPEPVPQESVTGDNATDGLARSADQAMPDAPTSPAKVSRPREEEETDGQPAVKRTRTDGDEETNSDFRKPDLPAIVTNGNGVPPATSNSDMDKAATIPQHKHLLRILSNLRRTKDAGAFNLPVDFVALNIPKYPETITNPMDLGTMEEKEKNHEYPTVNAFIDDFNQIIQNTEIFNGSQHMITQSAYRMRISFFRQLEKLPGPEVADPPRADKKKKAIISSGKPVPPRRESRSSLPGTAQSPVAPATPTFALGQHGVPIIRRDSTMNAERPKREIHPPAPRDLPYANQKPKKKKYQIELKFCQYVLEQIHKPRYTRVAAPFLQKVDPVALNIPTYFNVIRNPMDFGLMQQKLEQGEYENAKDFDSDARLVFSNCYKFNPPKTPVNEIGKEFETEYNKIWKEKQSWIEKQTPASGPTSAGTTPEGSDEEDEEEEEEDDGQNEILKLQQQIAAMSKQVELITQKKKSPPVAIKKGKGAGKADKKTNKKAAPASQKAKAKPSAKPPGKTPYVTYEQKQDISNRINSLPEAKMGQALNIIRENMPKLKGVEDDELELDIDELDNDVLYQLLVFVRKHAPKSEDPVRSKAPPVPAAPAPSRKKNKPMSKTEQENRIQQVRGSLSAFDNPNAAAYSAGTEAGNANEERDTSGDEEDSEESEEE